MDELGTVYDLAVALLCCNAKDVLGVLRSIWVEPIVIEQYWGKSSTDAAGIGEPATVPTSAAIANAVYNAIGVRIRTMPMTPAVVLAALNAGKGT